MSEFWEGDGILWNVKELYQTGTANGEGIGKREDGSLFNVEFATSMVKDETGKPSFMIWSFLDISEARLIKETLKESEERYQRLITEHKKIERGIQLSKKEWVSTFDAMSDWVSLIDLKCRFLRSNRSVERFVGLRTEEIIGRSCWEIVHGLEEPIPDCPMQKMLKKFGKRR